MKVAPCKDCDKRHRGCHDTCSDYKEWKKLNTARVEYEKKEIYPIDADLIRYNSAIRARRRYNK